MSIDARDTAEFYASTLGGLTANLLRKQLHKIWPDCSNLSCLGLGYAGPYLRQWREQATRMHRRLAAEFRQCRSSPPAAPA